MNTTAINADSTPASAPLQPLPDQPESWITHQKPIPFDQAAELVLAAHTDDGQRSDVIAHDLRTWAFGSGDGETMQLTRVPFAGRPVQAPYNLRELAFSQLCTKIGAPAAYIRNLPAKLQMANMNWGLAQQKSPALLRLADGQVRALLSERYAAADDELMLQMVSDCLDRSGYKQDALVRAVAVGTHTILRITIPNEGKAVKVGDVIEHGIDIGNSELGLRSVQVTPVTFRLVCTNGMRSWRSESAMRMRHIGDPQRLAEQLRDAIPLAFAEARGDIEKWTRAVDLLVDSALEEIESLRGFGLSSGEVQAVGRTFAQEQNLLTENTGSVSLNDVLDTTSSVYDLANAITSTARDRENTAARLSLEETAHRYLRRAA